ncbi:MAG: hypothetical protein IPM79_05295 [Polyangiaceae bacterium]|nr:hypothetical protein [Polyangiaceae bacterium]
MRNLPKADTTSVAEPGETPAAAPAHSEELSPKLAELDVSPSRPEPAAAAIRLNGLALARVASIGEGGKLELAIGGRFVDGFADETVHEAVLRTAHDRKEPVLVEERGGVIFVVGALRTQPTPGVDAMAHVTIEADRIELKAKEEIAMTSGVAAVAIRAIGEVETYADRILSRAESVHKIIGRMLRLN